MKSSSLVKASSLRKLMRAARQRKIPEERLQTIEAAMLVSKGRAKVYANRRSRAR